MGNGMHKWNTALQEQARKRAVKLLGLLKNGKTLEEAGKRHDMSRQRVHQLLTRHCKDDYAAWRSK